jgi:hypothetical protein
LNPSADARASRSGAARFCLALALFASLCACGGRTMGNPTDGGEAGVPDGDAGLDGGLPDAHPDHGPLDCGVPPSSTPQTCVQGRFYDFETEQPVPAGVEMEIIATNEFDNATSDWGHFIDNKHDPNSSRGRVDPNGRFFTWTNDPINDKCLTLFSTPVGFRPGSVNCYPGFSDDFAVRYYLVSDSLHAVWDDEYPGEADLQTDKPFWIATCRYADWSWFTTGILGLYYNRIDQLPPWLGSASHRISNDRRGFLAWAGPTYTVTDMPESGSGFLFSFLDYQGEALDGITGVFVDCCDDYNQSDRACYGESVILPNIDMSRADIESGEVVWVFMNAIIPPWR